jgi:hypothetical protein
MVMVVPSSAAVVVVRLSAVAVLVSIVPEVAVPVQDMKDAEAVSVTEVDKVEILGLHGPASMTTSETRVAKADTSNLLETILIVNECGGLNKNQKTRELKQEREWGTCILYYFILTNTGISRTRGWLRGIYYVPNY